LQHFPWLQVPPLQAVPLGALVLVPHLLPLHASVVQGLPSSHTLQVTPPVPQ